MIVTLERVKNALRITGNQKDNQLFELILLVEDWIKGYCNDSFEEGYPPGCELTAIKMVEYNLNQRAGIASESLSRHSVTFATEYPSNITKGLRRRLKW